MLTMLLGVGTREAIAAALVYLLAHACYKGALFLVAGAIDHEVGTRDITALAGLRRTMPITALAGGAAAVSMAGVPLTLGFVGKDGAYEALLQAKDWFPRLLVLIVFRNCSRSCGGRYSEVVPVQNSMVFESHGLVAMRARLAAKSGGWDPGLNFECRPTWHVSCGGAVVGAAVS